VVDNRSFRYCFLRSNTRLKALIRLRVKQRQTSLAEVCRINNLNYRELLVYMSKAYMDKANVNYATQKDVIALALCVGIQLDVRFSINGKEKL